MAVSVLRRYTPPTCTLEIVADQSPLSRWSRQPILKNLRFRLSLDGPHLPSDQHVTVQGDRPHLDLLCDVVDAYVQQILSQSASQFQATFERDLPSASTEGASRFRNTALSPESLPPTQLELGRSLVPPDVMTDQHSVRPAMPTASAINQTGGMGIVIPSTLALLPKGKLKHELWWGALTPQNSSPSTRLSTIELFDLANALSQYKTDQLVLPEQNENRSFSRSWMQIAAMFVLAVGTTGVLLPTLLNQVSFAPSSSETASEPALEDADGVALAPASPESADGADTLDEESQIANRARQRAQTDDDVLLDDLESDARTDSPNASQPNQSRSNPSPDADATGRSASQSGEPAQQGIPPELAAIPPVEQRLAEAEGAIARARGQDDAGTPNSTTTQSSRSALEAPESSSADFSAASPQASEQFSDESSSGSLPQIDEIRAYFQRSWRPPEDLERSIEYQLTLNPNGTLAQVTPLGQTARIYAGQAGIPAIGAPFVSPLENNAQPQIRLVLQPNGQVRAFLESWN
ncbi:MAG: DUF4335 domain-containing protein [Leptolyngbyaceae bacterium]|nr:DUF4335 domain-containing protein [Leptolyngbyaceae bacterium]